MRGGWMAAGLMLFVAGTFLLGQVKLQAGHSTSPGPVQINHEATKGPVDFDHAKHASVACTKCHHKGDQKKCFECHKAEKTGDTPSNKDAMHGRCKACHSAEKKGPTSCTACHK